MFSIIRVTSSSIESLNKKWESSVFIALQWERIFGLTDTARVCGFKSLHSLFGREVKCIKRSIFSVNTMGQAACFDSRSAVRFAARSLTYFTVSRTFEYGLHFLSDERDPWPLLRVRVGRY